MEVSYNYPQSPYLLPNFFSKLLPKLLLEYTTASYPLEIPSDSPPTMEA